MLKAIFGDGKEGASDGPSEPDYTRDENAWAALKGLALAGGNRAC
jgi:hypothetical protein